MKVLRFSLASISAIALTAALASPGLAAPQSESVFTVSPQLEQPAEQGFDQIPEVVLSEQLISPKSDGAPIVLSSLQLADDAQLQGLPASTKRSLQPQDATEDSLTEKSFTLVLESAKSPAASLKIGTMGEATLVPQEGGEVLIQGHSDSDNYGVLDAPVGVDAKGKTVALKTEVDGSSVSYKVANPASASFPVALAAGWNYTVTYAWYDVNWPSYVPYSKAAAALKACFNCSFPLAGAPKAYPVNGQKIPLKVSLAGISKPAPVQVLNAKKSPVTFTFKTLPGHFDGVGSTIQFNLFSGRNNEFVLGVSAKITSSSVPKWLNSAAAKSTWRTFAYRIARDAMT